MSRNFFSMRNFMKIVDIADESEEGPLSLEYTGEFELFSEVFKDVYKKATVRDIFWIHDKIQKKIMGTLTKADYE